MRFFIVCQFLFVGLIINLVECKRYTDSDYDEELDASKYEDQKEIRDETLKLKGKIGKTFALDVALSDEEQNMICSPLSAMMPLAKLVLGSSKNSGSEKELLEALGLRNQKQLKRTFTKLIKKLKILQGVRINLASLMYLSDKYEIEEKFASESNKVFESSVELIDTSRPEKVANNINKWISEHTGNMINNLVPENVIQQSSSLILINAVYFQGSWLKRFPPATEGVFYSPTGTITVPMMKNRGRYNYCRNDDLNAEVIEIPYIGGESAMVIVLPYEKKSLPILLRTIKLLPDLFTKALSDMAMVTVDVTIPKFKIETTIDLKMYYEKMNITYSMHPTRSNLSRIVKGETLYISNAIHKAKIEVTEQGTIAAAASAVEITPLSLQLHRISFKADHPFLFYIRAHSEQLFAGVLNSPK